jgi:transcriptional regulator with XRE-family HTH domain
MREWLVKLRKSKGYTQEEVAQQAGISQNYYSEIEHGKNPSGEVALRISKILGCNMERFYTTKE